MCKSLNLPAKACDGLLHGICDTLSIMDELTRRTAAFIQRCLRSDGDLVRSVASMSVFTLRMFSPLGRSAYFCVLDMV